MGEAPGGRGADKQPALELTGATGRAIVRMTGITNLQYLEGTTRMNLFDTPQEGNEWDAYEAEWKAHELKTKIFEDGDRAVLLGNKVSEAFRFTAAAYYTWVARAIGDKRFWLARAPHPSGRNRKFNSSAERERFGKFLREALGAG